MIQHYIFAILFAIAYGWIEVKIVKNNWLKFLRRDRIILDHFSLYHVLIFIVFFFIAYEYIQLMPLLILLEDFSYFIFDKNDTLDRSDWINWNYGGFQIGKFWLPSVYIFLIALYIILEFIL